MTLQRRHAKKVCLQYLFCKLHHHFVVLSVLCGDLCSSPLGFAEHCQTALCRTNCKPNVQEIANMLNMWPWLSNVTCTLEVFLISGSLYIVYWGVWKRTHCCYSLVGSRAQYQEHSLPTTKLHYVVWEGNVIRKESSLLIDYFA